MKMKKFFTLAALFTSSLAGAADSENKYYVGLNVGGGYAYFGQYDLSIRPSFFIGYNDQKNSKFELEINSDIHELENIIARFLINYRYYPDFLNVDPVTMYFSGGLGGHIHIDRRVGTSESKVGTSEPKQGEHASITYANDESSNSLVERILHHVAYKLKFGIDYAFTPQIIVTGGFTTGGCFNLSRRPDAITEIGIRYNF